MSQLNGSRSSQVNFEAMRCAAFLHTYFILIFFITSNTVNKIKELHYFTSSRYNKELQSIVYFFKENTAFNINSIFYSSRRFHSFSKNFSKPDKTLEMWQGDSYIVLSLYSKAAYTRVGMKSTSPKINN